MAGKKRELLRVGELARAVGKSVRAIHLYEELGLLKPASRSSGGFRLFSPDAVTRIAWIIKLQAIGFTLSELQEFVDEFEAAGSGRMATERVREIFERKLTETRETLAKLKIIENDLVEAIEYLESCTSCEAIHPPSECGVCRLHGHDPAEVPELFAGLSSKARSDRGADEGRAQTAKGESGN
jgi:DNA-binding transcriptional MerR regulator